MKIVTLSGVDGSGKSTQLKLLRQKLESEGKKVYYFHAIKFGLANRLSRLFKGQEEFKPGEEKAVTHASWLSIRLRKIFLLFDLIRFRFLVRRLQIANYDFLISDRYFYDSLVNIAYLAHCKRVHTLLEKLIVLPDYAFYLSVTLEEILKRERVPEQDLDYLKKKIELFEHKKSDWHLIEIDASQEKLRVFRQIMLWTSYQAQ